MKKLFVLITVLMLATMVLSACGTKAETPVVTEAPVVVTEAPPRLQLFLSGLQIIQLSWR